MSICVTRPDGHVWAYPDGSCWYRCLLCGHRWFGYAVSYACTRPDCKGTTHKDWRPDDPDGPVAGQKENTQP